MKPLLYCAAIAALSLVGIPSPRAEASRQAPEYGARELVGLSVPSRKAEIAAEQSGTIVEMPVADGDIVKAGQILFRLSSRLHELEYERLKALVASDVSIERARRTLSHAKRAEDRLRVLAKGKMVSASDLQTRELDLQLAELQLRRAEFDRAQAQNELAQAKERLRQRTLRSPFDGVVTERLRQPGETAESLMPVLEVVSLDPLWVEFECPVAAKKEFRRGTKVTVIPAFGDADERVGEIVYVSVKANPSSHAFLVRAAVANPDNSWHAGLKMLVREHHAPVDINAATPAKPGK